MLYIDFLKNKIFVMILFTKYINNISNLTFSPFIFLLENNRLDIPYVSYT